MPSISTTSSPPATPSSSSSSSSSARSPATRRKRSTPTASPRDTPHGVSSTSALVYPVPESIAWLEQLSLGVSASSGPKLKTRDVRYILTVEHARSKKTWLHARSFDEYRAFQARLHKALRHGHFCHAECPWLFTFVKSYFPKSYILGAVLAPRHVMDTRRETLERFLKTLQHFLVNRANHCCSVLTSAVADELLAFVNGDEGALHQCRLSGGTSPACAAAARMSVPADSSLARRSWDSNANSNGHSEDDDASVVVLEELDVSRASVTDVDQDVCLICHSLLAEDAYSPSSSGGGAIAVAVAPASSSEISAASPVHDHSSHLSPVPTLVLPTVLLPSRPLVGAASSPVASRVKAPLSTPPRRRTVTHFYTTGLACGHRFHDECIVPKLNESMSCPVCGHVEARET